MKIKSFLRYQDITSICRILLICLVSLSVSVILLLSVPSASYAASKRGMMTPAKGLKLPTSNLKGGKAGPLEEVPVLQQNKLDLTADPDGDGVKGILDNCPNIPNPDQMDVDHDYDGDECDNCPRAVNSDQADWDHDGRGDACEDTDGDTVYDDRDNCRNIRNPDQVDFNRNKIGDACEEECRELPVIEIEAVKAECGSREFVSCSCDGHGHRGRCGCDWEGGWMGPYGTVFGDFEPALRDGGTAVSYGDYVFRVTTRNAISVTDECHGENWPAQVEGTTRTIRFGWGGEEDDYGHVGSRRFYRPGTATCRITAIGTCGQEVTAVYSYSCP